MKIERRQKLKREGCGGMDSSHSYFKGNCIKSRSGNQIFWLLFSGGRYLML
jgi:hypothetical protein